jgi:hypothetical protein
MPSWIQRSHERLPDGLWQSTLHRVRGEFDEMPSMRVTANQARLLFGLPGSLCDWVLKRLHEEGFLACADGAYVRRTSTP